MLVGHSFESQIAGPARAGLDLDKYQVGGILRNPVIVVQRHVEGFGCPSGKLHNAGNDPNYAWRFLFMLFSEGY